MNTSGNSINEAMQEYVDRYKENTHQMISDLEHALADSFRDVGSGKQHKKSIGSIPVKQTTIRSGFDENINKVAEKLDQYRDKSHIKDFSKEIQEKALLVDAEAKRFDNLKEGNYVGNK